jgi:hypothetical protein
MRLIEAVDRLLQSAQAILAQAGIEAEMIEREGMPSFVICDVADEVNADLRESFLGLSRFRIKPAKHVQKRHHQSY